MHALGMMSGGLDSQLAVRVLLEQGIAVTAVTFVTPFFGAGRARQAAQTLGVPLEVLDISLVHLALVKAPPHGYGKNMNPCIDCHAMMFAHTGRLMEERGADFIFSGEVLGQRPFSQNRGALDIVARQSGYAARILRPLSAQCLPATEMETRGLVDRGRLLGLQGRTRKPQMALAARYGITDYPNPAGGCLLTDPGFSARLRELLAHDPGADAAAVERLKVGRQYRLPSGRKVIVGRTRQDNEQLERLLLPTDERLYLADLPGPLTVLEGPADDQDRALAAALTVRHSKGASLSAPQVVLVANALGEQTVTASAASEEDLARFRIG